jgi:hypothetical protein
MELALSLPEDWQVTIAGAGRRTVAGPDIVIHIDPLVPAPEDPRPWMAAAMARDLARGGTLRTIGGDHGRSELGWPMEIVDCEVVDSAGATVEARLGAFYKLDEWCAHALVRARDPAALDAAREQVLAILLGARPSWQSRDAVAAIAELWT